MANQNKSEKDLCLLVQEVESDEANNYLHTINDLKKNPEFYFNNESHNIMECYPLSTLIFLGKNDIDIIYGCFALDEWIYLKDGCRIKIAETVMSDFIGILYDDIVIVIEKTNTNLQLIEKFCEKWSKK